MLIRRNFGSRIGSKAVGNLGEGPGQFWGSGRSENISAEVGIRYGSGEQNGQKCKGVKRAKGSGVQRVKRPKNSGEAEGHGG